MKNATTEFWKARALMYERALRANIAEYLPWRQRARIATLEREIDKRDRALQKTRYHAQKIERIAASFGVARITDPRYTEIEMHALDARHAAEWVVSALAAAVVVGQPGESPADTGGDESGYCAWHGYHGMTSCPSCSSAVPMPLPAPPSPAPLMGWQCPVCGAAYGPYVQTCFRDHREP